MEASEASLWQRLARRFADAASVRVARGLLRRGEQMMVSRWSITHVEQLLPRARFGSAGPGIASAGPHRRLYCLEREAVEIYAAVAWRVDGDGVALIEHLAIAQDGDRADPKGYSATILLLERLTDLAWAERRPSLLAIEQTAGAAPRDLHAVGFRHQGYYAPRNYLLRDRAHPLRLLRLAYLRWRRGRDER